MRLPIEVQQRLDVPCTGDEAGELGSRKLYRWQCSLWHSEWEVRDTSWLGKGCLNHFRICTGGKWGRNLSSHLLTLGPLAENSHLKGATLSSCLFVLFFWDRISKGRLAYKVTTQHKWASSFQTHFYLPNTGDYNMYYRCDLPTLLSWTKLHLMDNWIR